MNNLNTQNRIVHGGSFKDKLGSEFKKGISLSLYFGIWFCALAFLGATTLREWPIPLRMFGFALIKAGLCAKFMLIGEAFFPFNPNRRLGIVPSLLAQSLIYLAIVLLLNFLESGVEGLMHGKEFISSLAAFGNGDPLHILALLIVYWLIVWPYLLFTGVSIVLGNTHTIAILFGPPKNSS
ncbi:hypothetical protein G6728_04585 [Polynucleobacter paneuropaeus]|nr:hypothetical protein G6728_04585 [Polynucleobacter paneuropaeus]